MAKDPAYPMYAQDFDMDTAAWGIDEIGIYVRLLNYEWINGHIPNDLARIAKIVRISPRKLQKSWEIISKKFSQNGTDNLQNKRMEEERVKRLKYIKLQRESGKKGAYKRWKKDSNPNGDPIGKPNGENMALQSSLSLKKESNKEKKYTEDFESFWKAYPLKRGGKEHVYKCWQKKTSRPNLEILLKAIANQSQERIRLKESKQFCPEWPNPATWINQGRWEDEVETRGPSQSICPECKNPMTSSQNGMCESCNDKRINERR